MINTKPPAVDLVEGGITVGNKLYDPQAVHHYVVDGDYLVIWFADYNRVRVPVDERYLGWLTANGANEVNTDPVTQGPGSNVSDSPVGMPTNVPPAPPPTPSNPESGSQPLAPTQTGTRLVNYTYDFATNLVHLSYETVLNNVTKVTKVQPSGVQVCWGESVVPTPELFSQLHASLLGDSLAAEETDEQTTED